MDRFQRLHAFLETLLANPIQQDPAAAVSKLQLKLERARPAFLELLDTPPKSHKERQELEKGHFTYVATGTTYPVGQALVKEILFLSDEANLSENAAASFLSYGINAKPRSGGVGRAESGLVVFFDERAALILCLQAIWRGALSADERLVESGIQRILERETEELTRGKGAEVLLDATSQKKGTFVEKIIGSLGRCKNAADDLRAKLRQPIASNALTTTNAPHGVAFSDETNEMRIQRLDEERRLVGQLLFLVGAARQMSKREVELLLRQLSQMQAIDSAAVYVLIAVLAALDVSNPLTAQQMYPFFADSSFVSKITELLAGKWVVSELKAVIQLQWSTFLDVAAKHVPNFETDGGELVDQLCWEAVESGVFAFLGRSVLAFKWDAELEEIWETVGAGATPLGGESRMDLGFAEYVTEQVELLVLDVITSKFGALRKLRNREEDAVSSSHRGGGHRTSRGGHDDRPQVARHDLESFFLLIATVHRGEPDAGLKFWEEAVVDDSSAPVNPVTARLSAFLRWGSESRSPAMMRAFYEMVASLASGPQSATYAFEFLSTNGSLDGGSAGYQAPSSNFSWAALFGALAFYLTNLPDRPMEAGPNAEGALGEMPPEEVPLLRSFIRLLLQVVAFSDIARATLYDNQRHRPVQTLFGLLSRPVPIELKASLLQAIAAFSRPGGTFGVDVARRTWVALEQSQILPTLAPSEGRDARGGAGLAASRGGILRGPGPLSLEGGIFTELEEVETPNQIYPESTAFVQLLNTLVHTPSSIEPIRRGVEIDSQTIPDNLGAPHRSPGVDPYVHFVIDDILLKTSSREFLDPKERWKVTDVCLAFVEKCLASFDLGPFMAWAAVGGQQRQASGSASPFAHLVIHPGFDMLSRLLSASPLLESVLTIVIAGYDAIRNNLAGTPLFTSCMLRCMRILRRTLELQAPFLEVVLPWIAESNTSLPQDKLNRIKSAVQIDQSLLYQSEAVVQIALLISCKEEDEIALLAVQILATIAESPFFDVVQRFPEQSRVKLNRLVGLLQASPETLRILEGVIMRLDEDVAESDLELGEWDGADGDAGGSIRQAIRSAILDLLLQNTQADRAGPNIAHLLLGFNVQSRSEEMEIDDPDAADTQRTALHVILDLLAQNVSKETDSQVSLLVRHPVLASKSYRLIRQLCLHKYTSGALSRYLRNREQFFLHQTLALPFEIPSATSGALGRVQFPDHKELVTSSPAVCATLQSEAWLLESTALELSVLAAGNDTRREIELIAALFENRTSAGMDGDDPESYDQGLEQGLPRMLEIFHSFDFSWQDSIETPEHRLNYFAELRFGSCLKTDATGCEVYDFGALLSLIGAARRELQNRGILTTQAQQEEAKLETRSIVETLVVDNHRREIQFARFHALRAWRNLLDIALTKVFHLLPVDGRHSLLLDLMAAILPPLAAQETDNAISELLSGAAVLLMTKLRDDGVRVVFVEETDAVQTVAPERLHAVLRAVLQAILHPGVSPVVRGNLYAVLLNYVQYSAQMSSLAPALARNMAAESINGDENMSVANDDGRSFDGASTIGGGRRSSRRNALESGNFAILQSAIDRLLPVICRDAAVGHEVWRTVAFTALDALVMVAEEGRAVGKVLGILTKQGYLQSFVASLKDAEADLQETLKPDPSSLNALYVYEAQMSFLIRLASSRDGAEKLMSAELLSRLADCEYLSARPLEDANAMAFDGFLPPATERHHQLLLPALQLAVSTLVSFGSDTQVAVRQAVKFVNGQRENLLIAIKDCAARPTMPALREAHLIVTLLSIILPSVSEEDITTLSSFGGLHAALLSLSARICGPQDWVTKVEPSSDSERDDDQHLVLALRDSATIFTDKVRELVESLQVSILTYQSVATRKQAGSNAFRAMYMPTIKISENVAAGPSLGSAGAFLRDTARTLSDRLVDAAKLSEYLDNFESTPLEEIEEAFAFSEEESVDGAERRSRVLQELQSLHVKQRAQVNSSIHLLELALLLYWRHVAFFFDPERADRDLQSTRPEFGVGLAESLRARSSTAPASLSSFDLPSLRHSVARDFEDNIVDQLRSLQLTAKTVGSSWRNREAYVGVIVRKLQDLLLMHQDS